MKLANIYSVDSGGAQRGQAATGTTDTACLDIKANDAAGVGRDIKKVVYVNGAGAPTVISRKLVETITPDFRYLIGPAQMQTATKEFCNAYKSQSGVYYLYCKFAGHVVIDSEIPLESGFIVQSYSSDTVFWQLGITAARYLYFQSRYGSYESYGYGEKIPPDQQTLIEIASDNSIAGATNDYMKYRINGGSWKYFTSSGGESGTVVSFPKFTEYSTVLSYGQRAAVRLIGAQNVTGCQNGGTAFPQSTVNIENIPVGTAAFLDAQGRTFSNPGVYQHYTTTKTWEE